MRITLALQRPNAAGGLALGTFSWTWSPGGEDASARGFDVGEFAAVYAIYELADALRLRASTP